MTQGPDDISAEQYRFAGRLFLVVGAAFAVGYVFTPEGPWRWLELAIAIVCLVRSAWYMAKAKSAPPTQKKSDTAWKPAGDRTLDADGKSGKRGQE